MPPKIRFTEIFANKIVYDHSTRLFPFSPRREIDPLLIDRLKRSIAETGNWQPIVVRSKTLEGIAGNHRFLATLELAKEQGLSLDELRVPVVLMECDEGLAVTIALAENELRENLTRWETVRALIKSVDKKPKVAETVFEVDGATVEQLRLWDKELDYDAEYQARRRELRARLTREWLAVINKRLHEYTELHASFMEQLQHPTWVQARSLEELDRAITRALISHGIRFEAGKTWNDIPTSTCLNCRMKFTELHEKLRCKSDEIAINLDGSVAGFCPNLRLFPEYTSQVVPVVNGENNRLVSSEEAVDQNNSQTQTTKILNPKDEITLMLDRIEAYCVAPDIHHPGSCFHREEKKTIQGATHLLSQQGLPAVLPGYIMEQANAGQFIWRLPKRNGTSCTPKTCLHAHDNPPMFAVVARPGSTFELVCFHSECGQTAKEALIDWDSREHQINQQHQQDALETLRQKTVELTLFTHEGRGIDWSDQSLLITIEALMVPEWDMPTMFHVVLGWQEYEGRRIAIELGDVNIKPQKVARVLKERFGALSEKPTPETIKNQYIGLRVLTLNQEMGLQRWVTCLAVVRSWRDRVATIQQIEESIQNIINYKDK